MSIGSNCTERAFRRLVPAWTPNPRTGIIYYKLESAIRQNLLDLSDIGTPVQMGYDLPFESTGARFIVKPERIAGNIKRITDTEVVVDLCEDIATRIGGHEDEYAVAVAYTCYEDEPMSDISVIKFILVKKEDVSQ